MLKYLIENGCPWNQRTCIEAALGHLEAMKYLREKGCKAEETERSAAAAAGYLVFLSNLGQFP